MSNIETRLNREQEVVLLIAHKYFYRAIPFAEIQEELKDSGLLDMTHNEFEKYRRWLIYERKAMLIYFDRPDDWEGKQVDLETIAVNGRTAKGS